MLSTDSFRNHHLCLLAWLLVTAEMSQHLASCLHLVLTDLRASGHLQLVYEGVQSCQDFRTMVARISETADVCEQLLVSQQLLRKGYIVNMQNTQR